MLHLTSNDIQQYRADRLAGLEADIFSRWQNRIQANTSAVLNELLGASLWPKRRFGWSWREWSRASALKDEMARNNQLGYGVPQQPQGRTLGLRVERGDTLVSYIHAEFLFDPVASLHGRLFQRTMADVREVKARHEVELGVPCFHAFAGEIACHEAQPPERCVVLNWNDQSNAWEYSAGVGSEELWQLFHPQTDQELSQRIEATLALRDPKLMRLEDLCATTCLTEHQVRPLSRHIPGARIDTVNGMQLLEVTATPRAFKLFR